MFRKLSICIISILNLSAFATQQPVKVECIDAGSSMLLDLIFSEEKAEKKPLKGLELLQKDKMPKHVCINMEGNRRWARKNDLPYTEGYKRSTKNALKILKLEASLGIKTVTIPCFSLLNAMNRPSEEIDILLKELTSYLEENLDFIKEFVCIKTVGDLMALPVSLQESLIKLKEETSENADFTLVLIINYDGRDEIYRAVSQIAKKIEEGELRSSDLSQNLIESYLDSAGIPDVDLYIQTGDDHSMSGAWKLFYTECFFTPSLWPDFTEQDFVDILLQYQSQERAFGF